MSYMSEYELVAMPFNVVKNNEQAVLSLVYYARGFTDSVSICEKSLLFYYQNLKKMVNFKDENERDYLLLNNIYYIRETGEHISNLNSGDEKLALYLEKGLLKKEWFAKIPTPKETENESIERGESTKKARNKAK